MTTLTFTAESTAAEINAAIRDADEGPLTVLLEAGVYELDAPIRIQRSDVTLQGAGVGETILMTASAEGGNARALVVRGGEETALSALKASTVAGDTTQIVLDNAGGVAVGMILKIEQENDAAYFAATGNTHLDAAAENAEGHYLRQMLAEVVAVDGDTVTLRSATPYAFTGSADGGATVAKVSVVDMLTGIEISDLGVTSDIAGTPASTDFTNRYAEFAETGSNAAVDITGVLGLSLHDVATRNTASVAFEFSTLYGAEIDALSASGAFNKGPEGNGYAFRLQTVFNSALTNLTDVDMRHSVLFGSFTAEHYNTIHVLSTNRDINFHGSADSGNTIVVDRSVLEFKEGDLAKNAVSPGNALIHPNATIEANDVTFRYLKGSWAIDVAHGHDDGSKLYGMGAGDELHGGAGVDLIDGGVGDDVLEGGAGADTFVFRRGYGRDTVLDFETGKSGDRLDLARTGITSRAGVSARQVEGDTVLSLGGGDRLTLEGISKAEYAKMNILFSAPVSKGVTIAAWGTDLGVAGTAGKDCFEFKLGNFKRGAGPDLLGHGGKDTLRIVAGSSFDSDLAGTTKGIDVLDMSHSPRRGQVRIDADFVDQSDDDYVMIKYGKLGLYLDTADIDGAREVRLSGKGQVLLGAKGGVVAAASGGINVLGNSASDRITGGDGDDRLNGGRSRDTLTGGDGDDVFVFTKYAGSRNADVITDFGTTRGDNDRFAIDNAAWRGLSEGWLAKSRFHIVAEGDKPSKGLDANDRLIYDPAHGDVWFDRDGSGKEYKLVKIAEVPDDTFLTHKDFLII